MARTVRKVEVAIVGDASGLSRAFRQADNSASRFGKRSKLGAVGMGLLTGAAAGATFAIGQGLVSAFRTGIDEMSEQQKVSAQTAAALKSTGNAAGVTQGHIESMASALQEQTGIQDDAIQSAQNLLLTFTAISNKGPDKMFDRATRAAMDLSVAFHKDLNSSTIMVGKALQQPEKGVTALTRVGVTFSAKQKGVIKSLVETGRKAEAQQLILRELEKQTKGSAAAYGRTVPGQVARAQRAWEDLTQSLVSAVVPLAAALLPALTAAIRGVTRFFQDNWPKMQQIAKQVWDWFSANLLPTFREIGQGIGEAVVAIYGVFREYWPQIWAVVGPALSQLVAGVKFAMNVIGGVVKVFAGILKGDWGMLWGGLKQIVVGFVTGLASTIKNLAQTAWGLMKLVGKAIWDGIKAGVGSIADLASWVWEKIKAVPGALWGLVKDGFKKLGDAIWEGMKAKANVIADIGMWIWGKIKAIPGALWGLVKEGFKEIGKAIVDGIKAGVTGSWGGLLSLLGEYVPGLKDFVGGLLGIGSPSRVFARGVGEPIVEGIMVGMERKGDALKATARKVVGKATKEAFTQLRQSAASAVSGLSSMFGQYKGEKYAGMSGFTANGDTFSDAGTGFAAGMSLRAKQKALADRQMLKQENALKDEVKRLNDDEEATEAERQAASDALADFYAQREIDRQQAAIDAAIKGDEEAVKSLANRFQQGEIDANTFKTQIEALLGGDAGREMGAMFGTDWISAFRDAMAPVTQIIEGALGGQTAGTTANPLPGARQSDWEAAVGRVRATLTKQWKDAHKGDAPTTKNGGSKWLSEKLGAWKKANAPRYNIQLAKGGIVTGDTVARIGEAGREAVIPLDSGRARKMLQASGVSGGPVINLTFNGVLDARDAARVLRPELDRLVRLAV